MRDMTPFTRRSVNGKFPAETWRGGLEALAGERLPPRFAHKLFPRIPLGFTTRFV